MHTLVGECNDECEFCLPKSVFKILISVGTFFKKIKMGRSGKHRPQTPLLTILYSARQEKSLRTNFNVTRFIKSLPFLMIREFLPKLVGEDGMRDLFKSYWRGIKNLLNTQTLEDDK